ncbi:MAG: DUF2334 domain-containing protein [Ignavibacteria bacterium]
MRKHPAAFLSILLIIFSISSIHTFGQSQTKKVLIVVQGSSELKSFAIGDARQLATLLGHFNTVVTYKGDNDYKPKEMNNYDYIFYIGFYVRNQVPAKFLDDIVKTQKPVIWLNTGMIEFAERYKFKEQFGFSITKIDSTTEYDIVKFNKTTFTKGEPKCNYIEVADKKNVEVVATAYSTKKRKEAPYIVRSKNLLYFADSPFSYANETDRYLLFSDMLHDILNEKHNESHSAILRIEDINATDDPDKIRDVADILSERGIPFLIGVIPFYVNPGDGTRLSLSDKPDLVDALKYAVKNGASIVMHGSTHQYHDITAADFEFWDSNTDKPIKGETEEGIRKKIEAGIQEFMKNGLYPVAWETPHYAASFLLYKTVGKYFSSAIEQRLAIENSEYSQYFPYIINKDLFGQKIYPENLGYVPLNKDYEASRVYVQNIIKGAKVNLNVRDGFAACFFHSFLDLNLLKELVDGVRALGYNYIDIKDQTNWVKTKDRAILTGSQNLALTLNDQYLFESYFSEKGEVLKKTVSDNKLAGSIKKEIELSPGELYKAEPIEFIEHEPTFLEKLTNWTSKTYNSLFNIEEKWQSAQVAVLWNHYAKGAAFNDQASLTSVFRSVNINVDTIFVGEKINLAGYNLLIVPFAFVDSLKPGDYDIITSFVENGGNLITDTKNELAQEFGIKFSTTQVRVHSIKDKFFPEERISWKEAELINKFEIEKIYEVFASDEMSGSPLVIGKKYGMGKIISFASRFDPSTQQGYSLYPFLMEYVRKFFRQKPIVKRDNLEVYFDPGFRHNISVENLIKQWVRQGIRIIHVSGWHQYPKYSYDYKRLIELAHANGILVYAWIEPPQVSVKFWTDHPEWREKNYLDEDVSSKMVPIGPSWRYPVALTDPNCLQAMTYEFKKLLNSFDWDGVNLAELYFEAGRGFENPRFYTPMHPSAQKEVKQKYGIELKKIFTPGSRFYWKTNAFVRSSISDYRVSKLTKIYNYLLVAFDEISAKKKGFQVIVTAMDSYGSPELREFLGVDMNQITQLQKKNHFLLQVEDPQALWSTDPLRYIEIGKKYASIIGDSTKLLLDLNIMNFRDKNVITPFPTLIQTGTESYHLVNAASIGAPRLTIYAESSVNPQDLYFMPYALASSVNYSNTASGYEINSPYSFSFKMPGDIKEILLDGYPLASARNNTYLIPAGRHIVKLNKNITNTFSAHELQTRVLSISANLLSVAYGMQTVRLAYEGDSRVLLSLSGEPSNVKVDGQDYQFSVMKGNDCYTIFLPSGSHFVELKAGSSFSYGISLTSLWSSLGIAIFGSLAVAMLVMMYFSLKIYKRKFK